MFSGMTYNEKVDVFSFGIVMCEVGWFFIQLYDKSGVALQSLDWQTRVWYVSCECLRFFLIASIISSKCSDQGPSVLLVLNLGFTPKKIGYRCAACFSEPLHYLRPIWSSDQFPCLL